jgi:hypothetical protein
LYTVVLPSSMYSLTSLVRLGANPDLSYLDDVQGRLLKLWFGVSKFCSTTSLREAVGWPLISHLVRESFQTNSAINQICNSSDTDSSGVFSVRKTRRNLGMYISNGLHHLLCQSHNCYRPSLLCQCKLCDTSASEKFHLQTCKWYIEDNPPAKIDMLTINKLVVALYYFR